MFGLFGAQQGMLGPLMPFLRAEFSLDLRWTGLHFAAYALGLVLIGVPYRWLEHKPPVIGTGRIAIGSIIVASGFFAMAAGLPMTLSGSVVLGFSGGLVMAVGQAMLGRRYGEQAAAKLVEAHIVAGLCVLGGALLVGAATAVGLSWRAAPLLISAWALLMFCVPSDLHRTEARTTPATASTGAPADALPAPRLTRLSLWALVILGISAEWGVGFWGAEYMKTHVQTSASVAATLMSLYFAGTVCGRLASSFALRRLSPLSLLTTVIFSAIATLLVLSLIQGLAGTAVFTFVLGACLGNFFPLILGSAMRVAPHASSALSTQASQAVGVALLLAPFLLGLLSERIGVEAAFSLLIIYPLLMLPWVPALRGAWAFGRTTAPSKE
ncbi:MFS transporter [Pseudomonas alliivorans]|uniref:MFS transporter n=1 Tax=Pseudomonas alliivorans TaxID=2810613 RepID=UPI001AE688E4|nr:MFS transporter [Pseudomonas alliivorans]MBP0940824.1 MFS transporter [Pseudomonas alliivorans]MEE4307188.1 MFS transporter [Pseudomonas alliivorans]MEE4878781.1 MFS transporter [Pseudomonas alliivorans]MEE4882791.1 MFS transporter [Pseudomonas alliivorans]MEE4896241.1 MFS transporter [Pseudomonas alliivorans]